MRKFTYYGSFASVVSDYFTNLFGVPDAAYSLRKLSPNSVYSGAAIRVRRSSDNTEQDINFVSSAGDAGIDTAALLAFIGAGNGFVVTWYNQDGSGNHATQTTAASQPRLVNAGVMDVENGKPCFIFDGTNDFFNLTTGINHVAPWTSLMVAQRNSGNIGLMVSSLTAATNREPYTPWFFSDNAIYMKWDRGFVSVSHNVANQRLLTGITNGINGKVFSNGTQIINANAGGVSASNNFNTIGRRGANYSNAKGQEVVIYSADRGSDRTAIETNINNYYNVF